MVLAFCRRGSVIPICLYLLVGRYMKERISGLRNESSKTKRTGLDQELDGSVNSVVSVTLFEIIMKKSNFSKMLLNVPSTFGKKYMKRGQLFEKIATLQTDGKRWPVVVRSSDRLNIRKGWRHFLRDNDLRVGDVLRFKIIDEENFILKVLIRCNQSVIEV